MPSTPASDVESLSEEARHHPQSLEGGSTHPVTLDAHPDSVQNFPDLVKRLTQINKKSSNQVHRNSSVKFVMY